MSLIKIVVCTSSGFVFGFFLGIYATKKYEAYLSNNINIKNLEDIPQRNISGDRVCPSGNVIIENFKDRPKITISKKEENLSAGDLLKLLDSHHSEKLEEEIQNPDELYYFGPQRSLVNRLDAESELAILRKFEIIEGRRFNIANDIVRVSGYTLHPVYINNDTKIPLKDYSEKVIGVRVKDVKYNSVTKKMSNFAIVEKVLDVGGQDIKNRGLEF